MKRTADEMLTSDDSAGAETLAATTSATLTSRAGPSSSINPSQALSATASFSGLPTAASFSTSASASAESSASAAQRRKLADGVAESPAGEAGNHCHCRVSCTASFTMSESTGSAAASQPNTSASATASTTVPNLVKKEIFMDVDDVTSDATSAALLERAMPMLAANSSVQLILLKEKNASTEARAERTEVAVLAKEEAAANDAAASKKIERLELMIDELVCDICLELLVNPAALTPCQHVFCWSCAQSWLMDSSKCPTCAAAVTHAHLNHKLGKLADIARAAMSADRIRPEEEIRAAQAKLERHKAANGSATIRVAPRYDDDDAYRMGEPIYWPCLACVPGNRSGFQCTHRIPEPVTTAARPARGEDWPMLEDAEDDGIPNISYHECCHWCSAWIPINAPGIQTRCFSCSEVSCQAFDSMGECPRGARLFALDASNFARIPVGDWFEETPLAGFNTIEKERFLAYVQARGLTRDDLLAGVSRTVKKAMENRSASNSVATAANDAGASATTGRQAAGGASTSERTSHPNDDHRFEEVQVELMRRVYRYSEIRSSYRESLSGEARRSTLRTSQPTRMTNVARRTTSTAADPTVLRAVLSPLRMENEVVEALNSRIFCSECLLGVVAHFVIWWWMEERKSELAMSMSDLPDCAAGFDCRRQSERAHAQAYNHICEPSATALDGRTDFVELAVVIASPAAQTSDESAGASGASGSNQGPEPSTRRLRRRAGTTSGRVV